MVMIMVLSKRKVYEEVVDLIIQNIKDGILKPGDRLPAITKLAEKYDVSAASIREALNSLKILGVVEVKHGQGTFIKPWDSINLDVKLEVLTKEDIKNLLEVRRIVETGCVSLAAERISKKELSVLEKALQDMHTAVHNNALGEQADYEFHMAIAKGSGNPMLVELLENVSETMIEAMRETRRIWLYNELETIQNIYQQHLEIFNALKEKDAVSAEKAMERHLNSVEKTLMAHF